MPTIVSVILMISHNQERLNLAEIFLGRFPSKMGNDGVLKAKE